MRKSNLKQVAALLVCGAFLFSSCIGSFALHGKLLNWNRNISTNSIEFWSGSNPMAGVGDVKKVKGENGNYLVKTLENGYSVQKEGETMVMELFYDQEQSTWNVEFEGNTAELLKMNENGTAQMVLPNGEAMTVILDAQGIAAARQATMIDTYYAAR